MSKLTDELRSSDYYVGNVTKLEAADHIDKLTSAIRALLAIVCRGGFTPQADCECAECKAVRQAQEALNG